MLTAGRRDYPDLDVGYVDRLATMLGKPAICELLSDGFLELTDRVARLEALAGTDERAAIARTAHDIVGTAGHLGLSRLSLAAVEVEHLARENDAPLDDHIRTLAEVAAPALDALNRHIAILAQP